MGLRQGRAGRGGGDDVGRGGKRATAARGGTRQIKKDNSLHSIKLSTEILEQVMKNKSRLVFMAVTNETLEHDYKERQQFSL